MNKDTSRDFFYFNLNAIKINSTHIHNGEYLYSLSRWNEMLYSVPLFFSVNELDAMPSAVRQDLISLIEMKFILPTKSKEVFYRKGEPLDTRELSKCYTGPILLNPSEEIVICPKSESIYALKKMGNDLIFVLTSELGSSSDIYFKRVPLSDQRNQWLLRHCLLSGANKVLDLGCGSGKFLREMRSHNSEIELTGLDLLDNKNLDGIDYLQQNFLSFNNWPSGVDLVVLSEVIEHLEITQVDVLMNIIFTIIKPSKVLVTTPNEIPVKNKLLKVLKHPEHLFEWNEGEVTQWAQDLCKRYSTKVQLLKIGHSYDGSPFFSWGIVFTKEITNEI